MIKKKSIRNISVFLLSLMMGLALAASFTGSVEAAGLGKPSFRRKICAYNYKYVKLYWTKVKGAKKYEIQRAAINPSSGKIGKWRRWAVTTKTSIKKKGGSDCRYRVRAIRGSKAGKWSASVRIFAADANITHMGYTDKSIFTVDMGSYVEYRILVSNKTRSPMGFLRSGTRVSDQSTLYAVDTKTKKVLKKWEAYLDTSGIAKQVNPYKKQSLYFYAYISPDEWNTYKNCTFLAAHSFYPNPRVEPMKNGMAIACYGYGPHSHYGSVAGK